MFKAMRGISLVLAILTLAGCKEVLYSDVDQAQANDMVAILEASGIASSRKLTDNGLYSLNVAKQDVASAVVILRKRGFPKERFDGLGVLFQAQGVMGTPFEQHVRFIHAMNQELSHTISSIAGVSSAKVLITMPLPKRYERNPPSPSASVTIHTHRDFHIQSNVAKIKRLVSSAVPNLAYDDVVISGFPASDIMLMNDIAPAERSLLNETLEARKSAGNSVAASTSADETWSSRVQMASVAPQLLGEVNTVMVLRWLGLILLVPALLYLVLRGNRII